MDSAPKVSAGTPRTPSSAATPSGTPEVPPEEEAGPEFGRAPVRGILLGVLGVVLLLVGFAWFARHWLWLEIRSQAEARGIQLDGCELEIGWQRVTLRQCQFASSREGTGQGMRWPFGSARVSGRIDEVEVGLSSLQPERVRVRGAEVSVRGEVPWQELLRSIPASDTAALELP